MPRAKPKVPKKMSRQFLEYQTKVIDVIASMIAGFEVGEQASPVDARKFAIIRQCAKNAGLPPAWTTGPWFDQNNRIHSGIAPCVVRFCELIAKSYPQ